MDEIAPVKVEVRLVPCLLRDQEAVETAMAILRNMMNLYGLERYGETYDQLASLRRRIDRAWTSGLEVTVTQSRWQDFGIKP